MPKTKKTTSQKTLLPTKNLKKTLNKEIKKVKKTKVLSSLIEKKAIIIPIVTFLIPTLFFMLAGNSQISQKVLGVFNKNLLSLDEAKEFTQAFITSEVLPDQELSIGNIEDLGSIYSFQITIPNQGTFTSYLTKDGNFVFPSGYDTSEFKQRLLTGETSLEAGSVKEMPKSDQPIAQLFLMSFCPYGNQAEEIMIPVVDLLKDTIDIIPRYIVSKVGDSYSSLHGDQELNQNVRELCVYKYQPEKFWGFLKEVNADCTYENADTCWTGPARTLGIDINKISQCERQEFETLLDQEIALTEKYQVSGSPTLLINDTVYQGSRTAESFKQAMCSAFNSPPEECSTVLGGEVEAPQGGC
ncbi:MAG: thioredoxin domain-containing protein [Candidatus Shapirobacteria bacterium]|nr:thioredoxin domain-containing protein [Candidatus Shapirobacteria bacterium]